MPKTAPRNLRIIELAEVISNTKVDERTLRIWQTKGWIEFSEVNGVKMVSVNSRMNAMFLWKWLLSRPLKSDKKVKKPVKVEVRKIKEIVVKIVPKPISKSVAKVRPVIMIDGVRYATRKISSEYLGMSADEFSRSKLAFNNLGRTKDHRGMNLWPAELLEQEKAKLLSGLKPGKPVSIKK